MKCTTAVGPDLRTDDLQISTMACDAVADELAQMALRAGDLMALGAAPAPGAGAGLW